MIYFIKAEDKGIKIGYTCYKDVAQRVTAIQTCCPLKIELIGIIDGEYTDENELHLIFSKDRIRGEWFDISILKEVRKIIAERKGVLENDIPPEIRRLRALNRDISISRNESIINHLVYQKEMLLKNLWIVDG